MGEENRTGPSRLTLAFNPATSTSMARTHELLRVRFADVREKGSDHEADVFNISRRKGALRTL
jgi:hypothetical protein